MPSSGEVQPAQRVSRRTILLAVAASIAAAWLFARPVPENEQHRRHFRTLQLQVAALTPSRAARAAERGQVLRLRAQARAAESAQRAALDDQANRLSATIGWNERESVRLALGPVLSPWRSTPLRFWNRDGNVASGVGPATPITEGCQSCHLATDRAGFEGYPQPLRTHSQLAAYTGPGSPHPTERIQCTRCHEGQGVASTFAGARHARMSAPSANQTVRIWADPESSDSMLPVDRTEAACTACHAAESYQPPAPRLSEALLTLDRAGCYGCHAVPTLERAPKRGPDLRHIRQKLAPEWVRAWLADPRRVKPAAWMPRFWRNAGRSTEDDAAIAAVTEFLFTQNPTETQIATPVQGRADAGKALVETVGCLGCHVVGAAERGDMSLGRTFGQALDGIGNKTTRGWLASWVRDPAAMRPDTRMPRLRLSTPESADVAAYLATLTNAAPDDLAVPDADDVYRQTVRRYGAPAELTALADASAGRELRALTGRVVIEAVGCVNCHDIDGLERSRTSRVPISSRRIWREADARAIHAKSALPEGARDTSMPALAPDYALGEAEGARLALALSVIAGPASAGNAAVTGRENRLRAAGRTLIQQRNCVGCHVIEGVGGDLLTLMREPALGPPLLTLEGGRVQPDWLRRFLNEPKTIRPWLSVRMPTFGLYDSEIERIGDYFRLIAPENPSLEPSTAETKAAGQALFELLKCQQCHVLNSVPTDQPTENLAPDLRQASERLQPAWIQAWLRDPTAILPGTRMPSFWPQFPQSYYEPLDRDAAAQIRAIRDHLLTLH